MDPRHSSSPEGLARRLFLAEKLAPHSRLRDLHTPDAARTSAIAPTLDHNRNENHAFALPSSSSRYKASKHRLTTRRTHPYSRTRKPDHHARAGRIYS